MYKRFKRIILFFILGTSNLFFAQTNSKVDSLKVLLNSSLQNDSNKVNLLFTLGSQYEYFKSKERIEYFISALNLAKKINFQNGIVRISNALITNLSHRQLYDVALEYFYDFYDYLIANNLTEQLKNNYKLYATLLSKQGKYSEALQYNYKALNYYLSKNNEIQYAAVLNNICLLHLKNEQQDSAYFFGLRACDIFKKNNMQSELANSSLALAEISLAKNDLQNATLKANEALEIYKSINVNYGVLNSFFVIGDIENKLQRYDSAIINYQRALALLKDFSLPEITRDCYLRIANNYSLLNKPQEAYNNHILYSAYSDSVSNERFNAKALEMDVKYSITKKENELTEKELQIESQTKQRNFLILGLSGILILLFISYKSYVQKKKANLIISEQKGLVEEKQKEILDSIHYAKRIQNTLLAHSDFINTNIPENFILFKPKDIVSGDFYWATKKDNYFYLAVCDSTGHGVPGAFMSLLNINFLNEAINEKNITDPNAVFDYVRTSLENSISKEGQKDGFDGILIRINTENKELVYSAANNAPLYITNGKYEQLPNDRMPVGVGERKMKFTLNTIPANKDSILYLYTDGFADQFGGPKGKKFKYKQLNELLLSISSMSMEEQKNILNYEFENWKNSLEQVDDVLLIGMRIS